MVKSEIYLPFLKTKFLKSDLSSLIEQGLLKDFIIKLIKAEIFRNIKLEEQEKLNEKRELLKTLNLSNSNLVKLEQKDSGFLKRFEIEVINKAKQKKFFISNYKLNAEKIFLSNKSSFDKYIYSLIRNSDRNIIFELYYQIESGESSINELAKEYSMGNEKNKKGLVGPVRESDIHSSILKNIKETDFNTVSSPFQIGENWFIVQKEFFLKANLNNHIMFEICTKLFNDDLELKYQNFINQNDIKI